METVLKSLSPSPLDGERTWAGSSCQIEKSVSTESCSSLFDFPSLQMLWFGSNLIQWLCLPFLPLSGSNGLYNIIIKFWFDLLRRVDGSDPKFVKFVPTPHGWGRRMEGIRFPGSKRLTALVSSGGRKCQGAEPNGDGNRRQSVIHFF